MAAAKATGARKGAGRGTRTTSGRTTSPPTAKVKLPPITVAKFEETGRLLERVVSENQSIFIEKGQAYKDAHRAGSRRPLTPNEAAQIAAVIAEEAKRVEVMQEVQESDLRAYDEPDSREILLAAGIGAAPKFMAAVRQVVALVEMPNDEFEAACENGGLVDAIEQHASELRKLTIDEGRSRASAAFAHYATSAGFDPGEAWRLPVQAVWQALQGAMSSLVDVSPSSQLIDSAANMEGSPDRTSSTDSPG